jgi:hypothetical protein
MGRHPHAEAPASQRCQGGEEGERIARRDPHQQDPEAAVPYQPDGHARRPRSARLGVMMPATTVPPNQEDPEPPTFARAPASNRASASAVASSPRSHRPRAAGRAGPRPAALPPGPAAFPPGPRSGTGATLTGPRPSRRYRLPWKVVHSSGSIALTRRPASPVRTPSARHRVAGSAGQWSHGPATRGRVPRRLVTPCMSPGSGVPRHRPSRRRLPAAGHGRVSRALESGPSGSRTAAEGPPPRARRERAWRGRGRGVAGRASALTRRRRAGRSRSRTAR